MNFTELYIKGMLAQQQERESIDNSGEKRYRGGNAGFMLDGLPANSCARKVIARANGRFEETSWNTQLMFDLGELNETRWHDKLRAAGVKVESADGLVATQAKGGTPITGSPDSIVADGKYLIEHKHISSFWTFRDIILEGNPKPEHLAQAGLYSMNLNDMPFCILYTSSVKFSGPGFLTNLVPKPSEPGSENFEYTYYRFTGKTKTYRGKSSKEKVKVPVPGHLNGAFPKDLFITLKADFAEFKNTIPTVAQFDLRFNDEGVIEYKRNGRWVKSPVSKDNIMEFYNYTEECEKNKELPERPIMVDVKGETKGFNLCDYCSLADTCDKYERDYDEWIKRAKEVRW